MDLELALDLEQVRSCLELEQVPEPVCLRKLELLWLCLEPELEMEPVWSCLEPELELL